MISCCIAFAVSIFTIMIILLTSNYHEHLSHDHDLDGVQKYHKVPVPRIGGVAIYIGFLIAALFFTNDVSLIYKNHNINYGVGLCIASLITLLSGLFEDLFKKITPRLRTTMVAIGVLISIYIIPVTPIIHYAGITWLNIWLSIPIIGILIGLSITFFCVIGLTNAFNVIDGYNGLSATSAMTTLVGLIILSYILHDANVFHCCMILFLVILGFLLFNYPKGKIFLGDGGAYFIGFIIAILSIKLTQSHVNSISPYAVLLLAIYPITEIGFSIYRKKFLRKTAASKPDGLHFHMLIYKRCIGFHNINRNSKVAIVMLFFNLPQLILTIFFYKNTSICLVMILLYMMYYVISYFTIIRFKTLAFLKIFL